MWMNVKLKRPRTVVSKCGPVTRLAETCDVIHSLLGLRFTILHKIYLYSIYRPSSGCHDASNDRSMVPWELKYSQANHSGLHYTVPLPNFTSGSLECDQSLSLMKANLIFPDRHVLLHLPQAQGLKSKTPFHI